MHIHSEVQARLCFLQLQAPAQGLQQPHLTSSAQTRATGAMVTHTGMRELRSKRICFNAWTKCYAHVTAVMVELMDRPFQQLKMDAKFAALEELFTKIYGGGAPSINEMRKLIFCQRNQNVEMLPPSQNALFQHCRRAMFQLSQHLGDSA